MDPFKRGPERIRTAVGAFAELCLTTRPQDLLSFFRVAKIGYFYEPQITYRCNILLNLN